MSDTGLNSNLHSKYFTTTDRLGFRQWREQDLGIALVVIFACPFFQFGMILQAAKDFNIDLSESYIMGDNLIDIEAGKNAGCRTVLVLTGKDRMTREKLLEKNILPDIISENILTAIKAIIKK